MATSYPSGLDSYSTHIDNSSEKVAAATVNNIQDAIVAIEKELGLNAKGTKADVKTRITDIENNYASSPKTTFALPATVGWYRVAQSAVDISRNDGLFQMDWTVGGAHGRATFIASSMYGSANGSCISVFGFENFSATTGITKIRVVYNTTYTANYAYLEVYLASASAVNVAVRMLNNIGWSMITPIASDTVPTGYTSEEVTLAAIATNHQAYFGAPSGTAPFAVVSNTKVTNLNSDLLDGLQALTTITANSIPVRDANGKVPGSITGDADSVDGIQGADIFKRDGSVLMTGDLVLNTKDLIFGQKSDTTNVDHIWFDDTTNTFHFVGDAAQRTTGNAILQAGKVYNAVYNDYAEWFEKVQSVDLEPGDVVVKVLGKEEYTLSQKAYDKFVVGVVSDSYGHIVGGESLKNMEDNHEKFTPIGLCGRVYVKVIGEVNEGDLLVSSDVAGCAMVAKEFVPGTIIGKALESNTDGRKKVKMFIMNQ